MGWYYENELTPCGRNYEENRCGHLYNKLLKDYSLAELNEEQLFLENKISECHAKEPPKKRSNLHEYRWWIERTHGLIDELRMVRDEIIKRRKNGTETNM